MLLNVCPCRFRHSQVLQVECRINLRSMTTKDHLHKVLTDMLVQLSNKHETFLEMKYSLSHPYVLDLRCVWLVFMINVGSKKKLFHTMVTMGIFQ